MRDTNNEDNVVSFDPHYAIPPCEFVIEELAARVSMSDYEFMAFMRGEIAIDEGLAADLEKLLGASATFWMNLQKNYDKNMAKKQEATGEEVEIVPVGGCYVEVDPVLEYYLDMSGLTLEEYVENTRKGIKP